MDGTISNDFNICSVDRQTYSQYDIKDIAIIQFHCHILKVQSEPHVKMLLDFLSKTMSCTESSCPFKVA